jgi:ABC-2 type transport system ATP-binding protein
MAAVTATGLTKRYANRNAVAAVDLEIGAGEVTGLLGPNGAGKTTLLRMLLGLIRPDAGRIVLLGTDLAPGRRVLEGVAGFVEEPSFYPYLSGRANLEVLAELDDDDYARTRIDRVLEQVELDRRAGDRVSGYSSGMRQRLGIAAALMRVPRLLLLDEPTSGLDPAGVRFVGGLIGSLAAEGVSVLLSSHQIGEIETGCDSFVILSEGRVVWAGTAAELRDQAPASAYRILTSDDAHAVAIAGQQAGIRTEGHSGEGFVIRADQAALDRLVLSLGRAGVAVRGLELLLSPLASMFFSLTGEQALGSAVPIDGSWQGGNRGA